MGSLPCDDTDAVVSYSLFGGLAPGVLSHYVKAKI